ncbi:hypothetical protein VVD49_21050 [Uliginosibacterium sp. H3]|uniref:HEPN AbiU2-like domain-containing protein n=1 Tax=Uliginosibacterium silvisoli TaxID=3114758 RepID=A0ABU6K9F4_9RHOO|nr:hypothetical protein [Uliginosibacterium sp. H3]
MATNTTPTVRIFAPELWGEIDLFRNFYSGTHLFGRDTQKALSGIGNHFNKAIILRDLAVKMAPNLELDRAELETRGFTPAMNSKEFSAVIEAIFLELYSSVDCARKIVSFIYRQCRRMPDSTRKLFQRVCNNELGSDFPMELKQAISSATWYRELLAIRDELTHSDIGSCYLDRETNRISYSHQGIQYGGASLEIEDVLPKIEEFISGINEYLGSVFHFLNSQLRPHTVDQLCGIFFGRAYLRKIELEMPINFNSGICQSRGWFDSTPGYRCPFVESCGAYDRAST